MIRPTNQTVAIVTRAILFINFLSPQTLKNIIIPRIIYFNNNADRARYLGIDGIKMMSDK